MRTPVRGTGLVYFIGKLLRANIRAVKRCACWIPNPNRAELGLDYVFAQLHAKGGSTRQLVVVDAPKVAAQSMEFPEGCSLALGDGERFSRHWAKRPKPFRRATSWGRPASR